MLLNKNKILMLAVMGAITNLSSDVTAQTFYQCMPKTCGANEILSNGNCYSTTNSGNWTLLYDKTSGEGSASLGAGTYIVALHGGNGGRSIDGNGGLGGTVTYKFTVNSSWTFKYGVGENGDSQYTKYPYPCGGGGGGSWVAIDNQYIVAGGGGGANSRESKESFSCNYGSPSYVCEGGSGGAVGAGNSEAVLHSYYNVTMIGGNSGNYKGGGKKGYGCRDVLIASCYNPSTEDDEDEFGEYCEGDKLSSYTLYPGYGRTDVAGNTGQAGFATHTSNVSISGLACGTSSGCVKLYKFKY